MRQQRVYRTLHVRLRLSPSEICNNALQTDEEDNMGLSTLAYITIGCYGPIKIIYIRSIGKKTSAGIGTKYIAYIVPPSFLYISIILYLISWF